MFVSITRIMDGGEIFETTEEKRMVFDMIEEKKKVIPLGAGSIQDVANAIIYLASDGSNYITGYFFDLNVGMIVD